MGAYSHMSLLEKVYSSRRVLEGYARAGGLLNSWAKVYALTAFAMLCRRNGTTNLGQLAIVMRNNARSLSYKNGQRFLNEFVAAGLVRQSAGKGTNYGITEDGKAELKRLDDQLRAAIIKYSRKDPSLAKLPGPKKGATMPNRWPKG